MQSAAEVDGLELDGRWVRKLLPGSRVLLRLIRSVSRQLRSESLEATIARAVDQAFAEFAREMKG